MPVEVFTVPAKGVGRADYSDNVSLSTEPLIRGEQDAYNEWDEQTIADGDTGIFDFDVPTGYVHLIYDCYASIPVNGLFEMRVRAVSEDGLTVATFVRQYGYAALAEHLQKGYPVFGKVRFQITNLSGASQDFAFGVSGVKTSKQTYYLQLFEV